MNIYHLPNDKEKLRCVPELDKHLCYIYAMKNEIGKIKIGRTRNVFKRYSSLSGSNSQGNQIDIVYCSPATFLQSVEAALHTKFNKHRINGTEWFSNTLDFNDVVFEINKIFNSDEYKRCNSVRKESLSK